MQSSPRDLLGRRWPQLLLRLDPVEHRAGDALDPADLGGQAVERADDDVGDVLVAVVLGEPVVVVADLRLGLVQLLLQPDDLGLLLRLPPSRCASVTLILS